MGKGCSKICHFHHHSTSSTTFVVTPACETQKTKNSAVIPEIALVTTNVTEENQEDGVILELHDSDRRDDTYKSLHAAIQSRSLSTFQLLLESPGTTLNAEERLLLLVAACTKNETDICRVILEQGVDVNVYTYPSENPLLVAIRHKNIEVVMSLIEAGATMNPAFRSKEDELLFSPVFAAVTAGDPDVLKLIVSSGGNLTATLVSSIQGTHEQTVMDIVDPRHEDMYEFLQREYPLALFRSQCISLSAEELEMKLGELALAGDYKLTNWGFTPWLLSCRLGLMTGLVRFLPRDPSLIDSCDYVMTTQFGMTGLMYATLNGHHSLCRALIAAGASVTQRNKWGKSAAHFAAETGDIETVHGLNIQREGLVQKTEVRRRQLGETVMDLLSLFCREKE